VIRLNDKELRAAATAGSGMPLDPGEYRVEAAAPGKKTWSGKVTIAPGPSTARLAIPALLDAPAKTTPPGPTTPPLGSGQDGGNGWKTLGFAVGGLGIAGIGVGAVFGVMTLTKAAEVRDLCGDGDRCNSTAVDANNFAKTTATVSTVGFSAGAACLGVGAVLLLTLGSSKRAPTTGQLWVAPEVGIGSARMTLKGQW
jgi:hypothetical protein